MLDSSLTDEEESWVNRDIVLDKNTENSMNKICEQWKRFKESGNKKGTYT